MKTPPALRHRRFTLLWGGLLISMAGSQMQLAALLWHLRTLTDQPIVVSGIGLVRFLPILLFAPIGGVVADSLNRRQVMFITQTTMALTAALLGLLTWNGQITIWQIYLLTAIQAIGISFDTPARQSLMPTLVPEEILPSAFSLTSIAIHTGAILGPALGGMVIGYFGQAYTYFINAISFVAVLAALVLMGPVSQESRPMAHGIRASLSSIREGVHFIWNQPMILSSMMLDFLATFFSSATTLLPFVARDILKVGEVAYGWLASAESMGAVLVASLLSQKTRIRRQGPLLLAAVAAYGLATILFGLSRTYLGAMLSLVMVGGADSLSTVLRNTIRLMHTPDYIRGRMISINQIFFMGGPQLGEIEAGMAAQALGTPLAIITGGIGCLLGMVLIAMRWPQLRRYDDIEPVHVPAAVD